MLTLYAFAAVCELCSAPNLPTACSRWFLDNRGMAFTSKGRNDRLAIEVYILYPYLPRRSLMVWWVVGSILHGVDPLSYFSFQPVLHYWCNKGRGMCYPVCGMVHIKEPLLLINVATAGFLSHYQNGP